MRKKFKRSTALLLAMIMVFSLVCDPGIVALAEESVTSGEVIVDADENISAYTTEEIETTVEGVTESEETEEIITGIETGTEIEEEKVEVTEENETETTEQQEEQEEIEATENEDEAAEIIDETDEEQLQKEEKNGECIESCLEGCIGETCECQCHATNTEAPTCIEECDQECSGEECECTCHTMVKTLLQRATDILENARQMDENTSQRNLGNVYKDLSTLNDEIGAAYQNGEITENEYQYLGSQMNVIANEAIGIIMGLGYDPYAIDETETHTSFTRWDTNPYFDYVPGGFYP